MNGSLRPPVFAPPRGYAWWRDPVGYQVAVPTDWRRDAPGAGGLTFTGSRNRAVLGITPLAGRPADVVATLTAAEHAVGLTGYRRVRIEALPEPAAAVWEYTFEDADGTAMRGLQRLTSSGGRTYVIEWRATRAAWATELARFTVVLASFDPQPGS